MADRIEQQEEVSFANELFETAVRVVSTRKPKDDLMRIARERAYDPSIFEERQPIFFGVEFSSNRLDAYFTRMAPDSLANYVNEALGGVSFQDSHRTRELGLGRTLFANKQEEGDLVRGFADVFTLPGLPDLDSFIFKYRAGIASDVSIGFYGGRFVCSICNESIYSWRCPHIPGVEYDTEETDGAGNVTKSERQLAFAWVRGAHLSEISAVYDGATPGAAILKAQRMADAGQMTPDVANLLEGRYRGLGLQLTGAHRRWAGIGPGAPSVTAHLPAVTTHRANSDQGATVMATAAGQNPPTPQTPAQPLEPGTEGTARVPSVTTPATPAAPANNAPAQEESARLVADLVTLAGLPAEVSGDQRLVSTHLRKLVADGKTYRERTIQEALTQGVRCLGQAFSKDDNTRLFASLDTDHIRTMGDQWKAQADLKIPAGRQTTDNGGTGERPKVKPKRVPDAAFGG